MQGLLDLSLRYRFFTLISIVLIIASGLWSLRELPIDAVPDLTPVQVQILTKAPALGPVEVEKFVTFPLETSLSGLPGLREIRSLSRYGLSVVTAIFEDGLDPYFVRQLVNETNGDCPRTHSSKVCAPGDGPAFNWVGRNLPVHLTG